MSLLNFLNENKNKERSFDEIAKLVSGKNVMSDPDISLPIVAEEGETKWELQNDPESLSRTFVFDRTREVIFFINELYKYSKNINHEIKIIIEGLDVTVLTTTHDLNTVTNQDKKSRIRIFAAGAGVGKTGIMSKLVSTLKNILAYFFCRHDDSLKRDPKRLIMNIALQISVASGMKEYRQK